MPEFDNLKRCYIAAIQYAMTTGAGYQQTKQWNELLHNYCEMFVDSGNYGQNSWIMKQELQLLKNTLKEEIELFYRNNK